MTTVIGTSARPDLSAEYPASCCTKSTRKKVSVDSPAYTVESLDVREREVAAREQAERQHRLRRAALPPEERREERDAARGAGRRSPASPSHDEAPRSARRRARRDRARRARAPTKSTRGFVSGGGRFGTAYATSAAVAIANGTLMMNTQRHEACVTSQPPTRGPITNATPVHDVH